MWKQNMSNDMRWNVPSQTATFVKVWWYDAKKPWVIYPYTELMTLRQDQGQIWLATLLTFFPELLFNIGNLARVRILDIFYYDFVPDWVLLQIKYIFLWLWDSEMNLNSSNIFRQRYAILTGLQQYPPPPWVGAKC